MRAVNLLQTEPYMRMEVDPILTPEIKASDVEVSGLMGVALQLFEQLVNNDPSYSDELTAILRMNIKGPGRFADMIATFISFPLQIKHELLGELDPIARLKKLIEYLELEIKKSAVEQDVNKQVQVNIEKNQREYILRQQLSAIKKELGEEDAQEAEIAKLQARLKEAKLPEQAAKACADEIKRLEMISPASAEYTVIRNYVEWLLTVPWTKASEDKLDLKKAREVLDQRHFGLDEVKDRIIEFLAVLKLKGEIGGSILCLQGPPGVGKTSLGRGIAEALGRSFQRISVGGLRDDNEIMGHRRTYVGAMPGKIIDAMKRAETVNPLLMIDEIDKMGSDFRGDPASAMLEVLDPEQNSTFTDRYLDVPYDLSKVMFICTANSLDTIPRPLLDRMEVIKISGYTRMEKFHIAHDHLIKRQLDANGLKKSDLTLRDDALYSIIDRYTREAGVRNLERTIGQVCRKVAVRLAHGKKAKKFAVSARNIEEYLGPAKVTPDPRLSSAEVGVATGLAWTPVGGEILFIEATRYPGKGKVVVTGHLGEVMQESVQAALSYVRANAESLGIENKVFEEYDIHVHFPEGATPKDGPSAGVTIVTAITSLLTERPVRPDIAMTGEVTLRGKVLAIGGVKEKVLAAHRAGINHVLLPKDNQKDIVDIPQEVRKEMIFIFSEDVKTNIREAIIDIVVPKDGMKSKLIVEKEKSGKGDAPATRA